MFWFIAIPTSTSAENVQQFRFFRRWTEHRAWTLFNGKITLDLKVAPAQKQSIFLRTETTRITLLQKVPFRNRNGPNGSQTRNDHTQRARVSSSAVHFLVFFVEIWLHFVCCGGIGRGGRVTKPLFFFERMFSGRLPAPTPVENLPRCGTTTMCPFPLHSQIWCKLL